MLDSFLPGLGHLQNFHPLFVHFPVAFLPASLGLYLLSVLLKKDGLAFCGFVLLILGAASSLAAAASGLYADEGVMVSRSVRAVLLDSHKRLMLISSAASVVLSLWAAVRRPFPKAGRWLFIILLVADVLVLTKGADDGGRLVYDYNAGGNACPQPIEFER